MSGKFVISVLIGFLGLKIYKNRGLVKQQPEGEDCYF